MRMVLTLVLVVFAFSQSVAAREVGGMVWVQDIPAGKAILSYERGHQGHLLASVFRIDGVKQVSLEAEEDAVDRLVSRLLDSLDPSHVVIASPRDFPRFDAEAAHQLFRLLVQPLMDDLADVDRLAIAADGVLTALPFDALLTALPAPELRDAEVYGDYPWLRKAFAISRLSGTGQPRRERSVDDRMEGGLLGFGNPTIVSDPDFMTAALPEANLELALLRMSLIGRPGRIAVGDRASEARFKEALASSGPLAVLALATHGYRVGGVTNEAVLALAGGDGEDGILTATEVRALRFRADLVILSACDSGASVLADAFIEAGGDRVLALRWPVLSDVARRISASVVARTQREPDLPHDVALWQAIDQLISGGTSSHFSHPMVWAPFVLTAAHA